MSSSLNSISEISCGGGDGEPYSRMGASRVLWRRGGEGAYSRLGAS